MTHIEDFIVDQYDQYVRTEGGEVPVRQTREAIRDAVAGVLAQTPRDLESEARALIARTLDSVRTSRSREMKRSLDYIIDAFTKDDGAVFVEAFLDHAFPLGREDGSDKTLREWTAEDFDRLVVTRYRVAAEATAAAVELDRSVEQIKRRMTAAGALTLGRAIDPLHRRPEKTAAAS